MVDQLSMFQNFTRFELHHGKGCPKHAMGGTYSWPSVLCLSAPYSKNMPSVTPAPMHRAILSVCLWGFLVGPHCWLLRLLLCCPRCLCARCYGAICRLCWLWLLNLHPRSWRLLQCRYCAAVTCLWAARPWCLHPRRLSPLIA